MQSPPTTGAPPRRYRKSATAWPAMRSIWTSMARCSRLRPARIGWKCPYGWCRCCNGCRGARWRGGVRQRPHHRCDRCAVPSAEAAGSGCSRRGNPVRGETEWMDEGLVGELQGALPLLRQAIAPLRGVWLEDKRCAIALHYRTVPERDARSSRSRNCGGRPGPAFAPLVGKCVVEIRARHLTKGAVSGA